MNTNIENLPLFIDLKKPEYVPSLENLKNGPVKTVAYWENEDGDSYKNYASYTLVEKKDKFSLLVVAYLNSEKHAYTEIADYPK